MTTMLFSKFISSSAMKLGNTIIELRNIKEQVGHDDSIPYSADVYFNNEPLGTIYNDGWGGQSIFKIHPKSLEIIKENVDEIVTKYSTRYGRVILTYDNLEEVCDEIASFYFSIKDIVKSKQRTKLLYFIPTDDGSIPKVYNIEMKASIKTMIDENYPILRQYINKIIYNKGIILNNNIPKSYIDYVNIHS